MFVGKLREQFAQKWIIPYVHMVLLKIEKVAHNLSFQNINSTKWTHNMTDYRDGVGEIMSLNIILLFGFGDQQYTYVIFA